MELILGMHPLGLFDALATPMYDAFTTKPLNTAPYNAIVPTQSRSVVNTATAPSAALSASLDFTKLDQIDQKTLDEILWHSVYGERATPPPLVPTQPRRKPPTADREALSPTARSRPLCERASTRVLTRPRRLIIFI